jgi:NAD(P)-dependent dehydrogenase (short-subunit alcohol dehydrogenase family)
LEYPFSLEAAVSAAIADIDRQAGQLDILVNNAAVRDRTFLAAPASSYVTGSILTVDGGLSASVGSFKAAPPRQAGSR